MFIDWEKIVLTINEKVSSEIINVESKSLEDIKSQNQNEMEHDFDLKSVLEHNQISSEQAKSIIIN